MRPSIVLVCPELEGSSRLMGIFKARPVSSIHVACIDETTMRPRRQQRSREAVKAATPQSTHITRRRPIQRPQTPTPAIYSPSLEATVFPFARQRRKARCRVRCTCPAGSSFRRRHRPGEPRTDGVRLGLPLSVLCDDSHVDHTRPSGKSLDLLESKSLGPRRGYAGRHCFLPPFRIVRHCSASGYHRLDKRCHCGSETR